MEKTTLRLYCAARRFTDDLDDAVLDFVSRAGEVSARRIATKIESPTQRLWSAVSSRRACRIDRHYSSINPLSAFPPYGLGTCKPRKDSGSPRVGLLEK